jgi:hypothetical protein
MYSYDTDERFNFSNVDEVLAILPVASEVMFHDCMDSCMRYLDMLVGVLSKKPSFASYFHLCT